MNEATISISLTVSDARLIYNELLHRNNATRTRIFEAYAKQYSQEVKSAAVEDHRHSSTAVNSFEVAYMLAQVFAGVEFNADYALVEINEPLEKNA